MRILLLGATGHIGGRVASELLRRDQVEHLTLTGRDDRRLVELNERLGSRGRVGSARFDIASGELSEQMRHHDVVVSCAGPGYQLEETCVRAAMDAGVHYISLNDDAEAAEAATALANDASDSVARVVSGCGAAPGLSNLLAALAVNQLDRVDEIQIAVGASTRDAGGPAAGLHFVTMQSESGPSTGARSRAPHSVYFPEPVGWVETFPCSHPEESAFRSQLAAGATVGFRIGLTEKAVMDVVRASVASGITRREPVKRAWLKMARPLQPALERIGPGAGGWTGLRVDVHGHAGDRARTISYGVVDRLVNLASLGIAEAAVRLPEAPGSGAATPEEIFEPREFLKAVAARGVSFARLQPHPL